MNLYNLIELKTFNIFPEYFLGISALYMLIVIVLISYNVLGLIIQRSISDCIGLILLLDEFGYPPVERDEVYVEILEQAENFKKYQVKASEQF